MLWRVFAYFRDNLGFDVAFEYGHPTYSRSASLWARLASISSPPRMRGRLPGHGAVSIFVDDVDALHADLVKRGARVLKAPKDYDYGLRDFDVADSLRQHDLLRYGNIKKAS